MGPGESRRKVWPDTRARPARKDDWPTECTPSSTPVKEKPLTSCMRGLAAMTKDRLLWSADSAAPAGRA